MNKGKTRSAKTVNKIAKVYSKYKKLPGSVRRPVNFIANKAAKVGTAAIVTAATTYGGPVGGAVAGGVANYAHKRVREKLSKIKR